MVYIWLKVQQELIPYRDCSEYTFVNPNGFSFSLFEAKYLSNKVESKDSCKVMLPKCILLCVINFVLAKFTSAKCLVKSFDWLPNFDDRIPIIALCVAECGASVGCIKVRSGILDAADLSCHRGLVPSTFNLHRSLGMLRIYPKCGF